MLYREDKKENHLIRNLKSHDNTSRNRRLPFMNERDFNTLIDVNGIV